MATADGDGWAACACGSRHWGRYGAAGLLLVCSEGSVLLQLRAGWTHEGGSWGLLGGARDSHEDAVAAALREAHEEAAVDPAAVDVIRTITGVDHGTWAYTYVLARARTTLRARPMTPESDEVCWVPVARVPRLPLHPAFAAAWPLLTPRIEEALLRAS